MARSLNALACLVLVSLALGCSPEAGKQLTDQASEAAGGLAEAAQGAADQAGAGLSDVIGQATEALSSVEGGSDMLKQVTDLFGKATGTLQGVRDADTATAALPELGQLTESLGGMSAMFGKLPDTAKTALAGVFESSLGQLKPIIDQVMAIPGVEAILKPAIDALLSKVESFKA
jgi:hypothetical protein